MADNESTAPSSEPVDSHDPRWAYELSVEQTVRSWPCAECGVRRDEHADQNMPHPFSSLDITDHSFIPALDSE